MVGDRKDRKCRLSEVELWDKKDGEREGTYRLSQKQGRKETGRCRGSARGEVPGERRVG